MKWLSTLVRILVFKLLPPLALIGAGLLAAHYLIRTRPQAERAPMVEKPMLVEAATVERRDQAVMISGMGVIEPAQSVALQPEVTGRIVELHRSLVPGGLLRAGEVVARIDARDYEYAVERAKAEVERAVLNLKTEQGQQAVARREWKLLEGEVPTSDLGRELALREPHLRNAQAALEGARAALAAAELALERTAIRAPFNALVLDESADLGQLVTPQTKLATLAGVDRYWARIALPVEALRWFVHPDEHGAGGAAATVAVELGSEERLRYPGRVERVLGAVDPVGRMARVLVAVEDPLGLRRKDRSTAPLPLFIDAYARADIVGVTLEQVVRAPRVALRDGDRFYVMSASDTLEIRPADIVWRGADAVLARGGLDDGDRLIVSRVPLAASGARLRLVNDLAEAAP